MKLANAYYLSGDSHSSLYYLQPISHKPNVSIYLLQIKLINEGDNSGATTVLHRLLSIAPHNPEAHNLKVLFWLTVVIQQGRVPLLFNRRLCLSKRTLQEIILQSFQCWITAMKMQ